MILKRFMQALLLLITLAVVTLIFSIRFTEAVTTPYEAIASQEEGYTVIRILPVREVAPAPAMEEAEMRVFEEPSEADPLYTEEELEYMAIVIYQESGSDSISDETRIMVGNVVLNRVADERFPDTIYDVLTQRSQYGRFHWTGIVWPEQAEHEPEAVERAYDCARRVLEGEKILPDTAVWQAEFIQGNMIEVFQDGIYFCS